MTAASGAADILCVGSAIGSMQMTAGRTGCLPDMKGNETQIKPA